MADYDDREGGQVKFYKILASEPITDTGSLFDDMSKFLTRDKTQQIATGFGDDKLETALRLSWNELRRVANSVLDKDDTTRDPIPAWLGQRGPIVIDGDDDGIAGASPGSIKREPSGADAGKEQQHTPASSSVSDGGAGDDDAAKKERKRIKKEKKKAEKAEKKAAKKEAKRKRKSIEKEEKKKKKQKLKTEADA